MNKKELAGKAAPLRRVWGPLGLVQAQEETKDLDPSATDAQPPRDEAGRKHQPLRPREAHSGLEHSVLTLRRSGELPWGRHAA